MACGERAVLSHAPDQGLNWDKTISEKQMRAALSTQVRVLFPKLGQDTEITGRCLGLSALAGPRSALRSPTWVVMCDLSELGSTWN